MLESTLVVVMSEFGRTPRINRNYGRDHWSKAWSIAGRLWHPGRRLRRQNKRQRHRRHRPRGARRPSVPHIFPALGLNPKKNYYIQQQPIPMADPQAAAIEELLA